MPTAVVTGASRGLGLENCRRFAAAGWNVYGACRDPDGASDLAAIPGVRLVTYDAADPGGAEDLKEALGDAPVDLLLNNAGMNGAWDATQMLSGFDRNICEEIFAVNTIGPIEASKALIGNVAASERKIIVNVSSMLGSATILSMPGLISYRMSKAALNIATRSMAAEWKDLGVTVVSLHPGWVQTALGGPMAPMTVDQSVDGQQALFAKLSIADSGKFLQFNGEEHPW